MFGIGSTELLVILVVALVVLGPSNLAKVTRTLGKALGEFRRVSTDFQRTLNAEAAQEEAKQAKKEAPKVDDTPPASPQPPEGSPVAEAIANAGKEASDDADNANKDSSA